ncbi:MAG: 4-hydroxy-3-methylbut-2-enyl diphosphate reductase [Spirochaetia bacterium]|nr:4-hydroxy-3-methylbut-2-enyl diphosphate reductase [Spirochaetia bacterium]
MKIIRAKVLGYCMGVRRAVQSAENALAEQNGNKIFTLGPLIHNPCVLKNLEEKGLKILDEENLYLADSKSTVIIRAHGTTPSVLQTLEISGAKVLDATCPRVHLSQKRAAEYYTKGYSVIIAGDRNHGEVVSISGYARNDVTVIENHDEAEKLELNEKTILIAQTTFSPKEFEKIVEVLKSKNEKIVVLNSICSATLERQNALKDIAGLAQGILVIGGKNSANTRRLYETACTLFEKVLLIQNESEITEDFFAMESVAITAGASTPDYVIDRVEEFLSRKSAGKSIN